MGLLRDRDYARLLDLAVTVIEQPDGGSPWPAICAAVMEGLRAPFGGYFSITWPSGAAECVAWPTWQTTVPLRPRQVLAHPLVQHYGTSDDACPRTIDEVADGPHWRSEPAHASAREHFDGATQHLYIPLSRSAHRLRSVGLGRPGRTYSARERQLARAMQPLVVAVDRHRHVTQQWLDRLGAAQGAAVVTAAAHRLTPREVTVLDLLARGLTASAIARALRISPHTAIKHKQNVYRKLGTADRLTTVMVAQRLGLLPSAPCSGSCGPGRA